MVPVLRVDIGWLVPFINAYSPQAQTAAGTDAVPPERADQAQPQLATLVTGVDKKGLAGALWCVFGVPTLGDRVDALDSMVAASRLDPHVDIDGDLQWTTRHHGSADLLSASCTVCLVDAITTYGWSRLGICAGCDCVDVYLDRANRAPRRYCSATCLNRAKVRAFRSRRAKSQAIAQASADPRHDVVPPTMEHQQ